MWTLARDTGCAEVVDFARECREYSLMFDVADRSNAHGAPVASLVQHCGQNTWYTELSVAFSLLATPQARQSAQHMAPAFDGRCRQPGRPHGRQL